MTPVEEVEAIRAEGLARIDDQRLTALLRLLNEKSLREHRDQLVLEDQVAHLAPEYGLEHRPLLDQLDDLRDRQRAMQAAISDIHLEQRRRQEQLT